MPDLAAKLHRLNEAVHQLNAAGDEADLLDRIVKVVEYVFSRDTAAVLLKEPDGEHLRIHASHGYKPEVVASFRGKIGEGVAGYVAATGKPRLVADVTTEPNYVAGVDAAASEMAVPLLVDGEVIGVLDVESREEALSAEDMALLQAFGEQAAWAMRHGRVLEAAAERARRMELLNRGARALNAIHDPDTLLERILELADEALGIDNVAILVADDARQNLTVRKALRPDGIEGMVIPVAEGVTGAVFRTGVAEIVPDVSADPRYISGGLDGTHAEIVAPLRLNGQIVGVLDAEGEQVGSFNDLDLEVFTAFANHVAIALRNAELMTALEDRANRLRQIVQTGRALNTVHGDAILDEIINGVTEALGLGQAAILLRDREAEELVVTAAKGYGDIIGKRIRLGTGVTGLVAATGDAALVGKVATDRRYVPGVEGGVSEMAVPLQVRGELLGVLDTETPNGEPFTDRDLELFQAFADQAAVALNNARLIQRLETANDRLTANIEEVKRLNSELEVYAGKIADANRSLEYQVKQLTTLHQAGQAITSSLDLKETLAAILAMSSEIVASSAGAIKLIDTETRELKTMAQAGSVDRDDAVRTYDVPLKIGDRTIGVFEIAHLTSEELSADERKMLETLASQAAIAIENARLFEDTQRVYYDTLKALAKALEARDQYTRGHSERVAQLAKKIAADLNLDKESRSLIFNSALLHDIGKIGIRDAVLLAPRPLTEEELAVIRQHPTFGNIILGPLKFLGEVSNLVRHHHERWDGTGYPDGLKADAIPLPSRIIAVADTFDAMTSNRPYRAARARSEAIDEILAQSGSQFDPAVVEAFTRVTPR